MMKLDEAVAEQHDDMKLLAYHAGHLATYSPPALRGMCMPLRETPAGVTGALAEPPTFKFEEGRGTFFLRLNKSDSLWRAT
jgi:hypothetical protein